LDLGSRWSVPIRIAFKAPAQALLHSHDRERVPDRVNPRSQPDSLCGEFVLVKQAAESVAPMQTPLTVLVRDGSPLWEGRLLTE
jgi:hypothetical protein